MKLILGHLCVYFFLFIVKGFSQEEFEINDLGIANIKIGDSIKQVSRIAPLNKSEFRAFPSEKYYYMVNMPYLSFGTEKIKINTFILSVSKDSCINNIFVYLFDPKNLLEKYFTSNNYKSGWTVSNNNSEFSIWITPSQTGIAINKKQYSKSDFSENYLELRFFKLTDSIAIRDYFILTKPY